MINFMNSSQIYKLIENIAVHPKKTDKERLLKEADCPELRRVLVSAYNPRANYYIKKVGENLDVGNEDFSDNTWEILNSLSARKITGDMALLTLEVALEWLNKPSQELLKRIIKRDLRAGFSASTINKVFPKILPEYPYMRCSLLSKVDTSKWDWSEGNISQLKMDGMFCNISVFEDGTVSMTSRQGSEFPLDTFSDIIEHMSTFGEKEKQYHGELLVVGKDGKELPREIGNGMLNSVLKGGEFKDGCHPRFVAWDVVDLNVVNGVEVSSEKYYDRLQNLLSTYNNSKSFSIVETKRVVDLQEAFEHYQDALSRGCEGTILKNRNGLWRDGTSKDQLKLKLEVDVDLEIVGFTEGNGKNAETFGSVTCVTSDRMLKVDVSGFSDEMRLHAHQNRGSLVGTIMTVRANEIMYGEPASLFLPRFVELRDDKAVADSFQDVIDQFENAKKGL